MEKGTGRCLFGLDSVDISEDTLYEWIVKLFAAGGLVESFQ